MQVSAQNSLTWLQSTPAAMAAADSISSADGQVSPSTDAAGADSGLASMSAMQSPAQMFAPASLGTLISSQSSDSDVGASAAASSATTTGAPAAHHHHHHGGGAAPTTDTQDTTGGSSATSIGATTATSATASGAVDASAETDLSQILASL